MGILIILMPLVLYLIVAFTGKKESINHPDDYFSAFRKVGETEFTSSSVAYGFQVSTIYPFLFWGASLFLFVPFVNAIFWGLGILLFYLSFNKISKYLGKGKTLHGLIGKTYGNKARVVASYLTILGFVGYIIAELWFGSRVLLAVLPSNNWIYFSAFIFIIFISIYLFKEGQISSIKTDQLQLIFTYLGVFGIIIYLLYATFKNGQVIAGALNWGLLITIILAILILVIRKFKFIKIYSVIDNILNIVVSLLFVLIIILGTILLVNNSSNFQLDNFVNLEGFGVLGLISLIILPLSWQFVDLTNWQRILSVKNDNSEIVNKSIKKGLLTFSIESPFTWILFLIFGLLISTVYSNLTFDDILIDFPKQMINSTNSFEVFIGYTFIVSIISIMLSTIDSFIMGIAFTYTYDINSKSRKLIDENETLNQKQLDSVLAKGKIFGFATVLLSICLFVIFDKYVKGGGDLFINLLLTFYTASLSFLPLVFGLIFLKKLPKENWAILSMTSSAIVSIGIGVYSVLVAPEYAWYPLIVCVLLSGLIYTIGYFRIKRYEENL